MPAFAACLKRALRLSAFTYMLVTSAALPAMADEPLNPCANTADGVPCITASSENGTCQGFVCVPGEGGGGEEGEEKRPNGTNCYLDEQCESGNCVIPENSTTGTGDCQAVPEMETILIPGFILAAAGVARRSRKRARQRVTRGK